MKKYQQDDMEQAIKLYREGSRLLKEGNKIRAKANKLYKEAEKNYSYYALLWENDTPKHVNKLRIKIFKLYEESNKLWTRADELRSDAYGLWIKGLTESFGYVPDCMKDLEKFV